VVAGPDPFPPSAGPPSTGPRIRRAAARGIRQAIAWTASKESPGHQRRQEAEHGGGTGHALFELDGHAPVEAEEPARRGVHEKADAREPRRAEAAVVDVHPHLRERLRLEMDRAVETADHHLAVPHGVAAAYQRQPGRRAAIG